MRLLRGARRAQRRHLPATAPARPAQVIACVDPSDYLESVCDHAAWFACKVPSKLELLHVQDTPAARAKWGLRGLTGARGAEECSRLLARATGRLTEQGVEGSTLSGVRGDFPEIAGRLCAAADLVVLGRHRRCDAGAQELGPNLQRLLRRVSGTICIAPKLFLPISRALVVPPTNARDRSFTDALATTPYLDGLAISVAAPPAPDERLGGDLEGAGPDLVVLPRAALLAADADRLLQRAAQRLLGSPLPVLLI